MKPDRRRQVKAISVFPSRVFKKESWFLANGLLTEFFHAPAGEAVNRSFAATRQMRPE